MKILKCCVLNLCIAKVEAHEQYYIFVVYHIHGACKCGGVVVVHDSVSTTLLLVVHGNWSEWGGWSPCLAEPCKGEKGLQMRTRTCTSPQPRFGGDICVGNSTQMQECFNNFGCPGKMRSYYIVVSYVSYI